MNQGVKSGKPSAAPSRNHQEAAGHGGGAPRSARRQWRAEYTQWFTTASRILLGAVLVWFGYHELTAPLAWTGYVPVIHSGSFVELLVLAHGWLLLLLGIAILFGISPRIASLIAAVLLLQIVVSLTATGGLSDLVLRDVGVLGLALAATGAEHKRLLLRQ